ncbi:MAG TPA: hypothetical protein VM262_04070 [Acidimicrobiales bacterium]|nr:hypothetical protein [Acidimicrobiales bacterium]
MRRLVAVRPVLHDTTGTYAARMLIAGERRECVAALDEARAALARGGDIKSIASVLELVAAVLIDPARSVDLAEVSADVRHLRTAGRAVA